MFEAHQPWSLPEIFLEGANTFPRGGNQKICLTLCKTIFIDHNIQNNEKNNSNNNNELKFGVFPFFL
jgi:hypothetical protein